MLIIDFFNNQEKKEDWSPDEKLSSYKTINN